jgi:hypothetical protein
MIRGFDEVISVGFMNRDVAVECHFKQGSCDANAVAWFELLCDGTFDLRHSGCCPLTVFFHFIGV